MQKKCKNLQKTAKNAKNRYLVARDIMSQNSMNHCSFCGKPEKDVKRLIAADGVAICNECIEACSEIIGYSANGLHAVSSANLAKQNQIKSEDAENPAAEINFMQNFKF